MFISIDHTQFNKHNIILSDKLNNNIMENGFFYRIFYSDTFYSSNGIIINFNLKNVTLENYFNKIKCYHNKSNNQDIINNITTIEKNLIEGSNDLDRYAENASFKDRLNNIQLR